MTSRARRLRNHRLLLAGFLGGAILAAPIFTPVAHASPAPRRYDIAAQNLDGALRAFAVQTGRDLIYSPAITVGKTSPGIHGTYSEQAALNGLLAGTGLRAKPTASGGFGIQVAVADAAALTVGDDPLAEKDIVVTGSRIKGAASASPVTEVTSKDMQDAGYTNLGDVVRSLPQNFSAGQNPGVISGGAGHNLSNQNISGGSSLDLRGLGPDATLTLLDGRRLSYDGFSQAVDLTMVPLAAVDRIEILTDGASAIYGSDAVAGVANIILKQDMTGITALGRIGGATDGGDFQRQLSLTGGGRWPTGGFLLALNAEHDDAVDARDRSYADNMGANSSLMPAQSQYNALLTAHQDIGDVATFKIDALYANRLSNDNMEYTTESYLNRTRTKQFTISPSVAFHLPHDWSATLAGVVGQDHVHLFEPISDAAGNLLASYGVVYNDSTQQADLSFEGPLLRLPGGQARLALGGGWRRNHMDANGVIGTRSSEDAFEELNLPIISPDLGIPGIRRLSLNEAVRHEHYSDLGNVTTPKVGIVYSPTNGIEFGGSWSKSFKAPTLLQTYQSQYVAVFPASSFGSGYPTGAQALLIGGGNRNLKPERATTLTLTTTLQPQQVPGLKLVVSGFSIRYRDRVVQPILSFAQTFSNPLYARYVSYNPNAAEQASLIAGAGDFYSVGPVYDADSVVAIINDAYINVSRQKIDGVDISTSYDRPFVGGKLEFSGTATWLRIRQQFIAGDVDAIISGTVFNPPHFRARAGILWDNQKVSLAAYLNAQSGLTNLSTTTVAQHIASQRTVDLTMGYKIPATRFLHDVAVSLSVQNLFNAQPPYMTPQVADYPAFDSTNFSTVGRFVSFSISTHL